MKTLTYTGILGPETISFGEAGQFTKGKSRQIHDDALADQLLAKGCFMESEEPGIREPSVKKIDSKDSIDSKNSTDSVKEG